MRETMSKWNYVIGARELISGDRCPRRQRGHNEDRVKEKEAYDEGKRSDCNITPCLHLKLQRRITHKGCELEVDIRGNWQTGHVRDSDVVVLKVLQRGVRTRRGLRAGVVAVNDRVLDHGLRGSDAEDDQDG